MKIFGQPLLHDDEEGVDTPVGQPCFYCGESIREGDRGGVNLMGAFQQECAFRAAMGGIGHHEDHAFWCGQMGDPDGGRTYRQSALEVWAKYANRPPTEAGGLAP